MRFPSSTRVVPLVCLALLCLVCAAAAQAKSAEAKLYAITNWPSSGQCKGTDVPNWDNMTLAWYNEVTSGPVFFSDGVWINNSLSRKILCDPDSGFAPCEDFKQVDDADVAMLAFHGADKGKHWAGLLQVPTGGDCFIHAPEGASTDAFFVGDADLEFLHFSSCHSMDDDNLNESWRMFADVDSPKNGHRLHQADGFHGVMAISSGRADDYEDFADDAHSVPIADAWLDNLYDEDITYNNGSNGDQCPVALSVGGNLGEALTRLVLERYTFVFPDPSGNHFIAYLFYDRCDPVGDSPFVDPNLP